MAKTEKMCTIDDKQFGKIGSCLKNESVRKSYHKIKSLIIFCSILELGKRRWFAKDLWAIDEDLLRRNKQVTFLSS
jgi:hypothetical protein